MRNFEDEVAMGMLVAWLLSDKAGDSIAVTVDARAARRLAEKYTELAKAQATWAGLADARAEGYQAGVEAAAEYMDRQRRFAVDHQFLADHIDLERYAGSIRTLKEAK